MTQEEFEKHKRSEIERLQEWERKRQEEINVRDTYGALLGNTSREANPYREIN